MAAYPSSPAAWVPCHQRQHRGEGRGAQWGRGSGAGALPAAAAKGKGTQAALLPHKALPSGRQKTVLVPDCHTGSALTGAAGVIVCGANACWLLLLPLAGCCRCSSVELFCG